MKRIRKKKQIQAPEKDDECEQVDNVTVLAPGEKAPTLEEYIAGKEGDYTGAANNSTAMERMMALDSQFREQMEGVQQHWLNDANKVLADLIGAIQTKATDPGTKVNDLAKAIDVISNKLATTLGKPTSITGHLHAHKHSLSDADLDERIASLGHQLAGGQKH